MKTPPRKGKRHKIQADLTGLLKTCVLVAFLWIILRQYWFLPTTTLASSSSLHLRDLDKRDLPLPHPEKRLTKHSNAIDKSKGPAIRDNASATSTNSTAVQHRLPTMAKGGFVFFLHVPKTGGSTIRQTLMASKHIDYYFVAGAGQYNDTRPAIADYLLTKLSRPRKIFFLEIHGRDSPHLLQLQDTLRSYRRMAQKQGIPTFFFTVLRDPIPYALSYFNFFHVQRKNKNFRQVAPTEANLLELSLHNPQCQFLAKGENSLRESIKVQPTADECQQVQTVLRETMDWVGTTERLNQDTLPLLRYILNARLEFAPVLVSSKAKNQSISQQDLSATALEQLTQMSEMDAALYQMVQQQYSYDMWSIS